jgi:hypothetical protein
MTTKMGAGWFSPFTSQVKEGGRIRTVNTILWAVRFQPHILYCNRVSEKYAIIL